MSNLYETREYAYYCPKCGQCHFISYGSNEMCLVCNTRMIQSPSKYNLTQSCWLQSDKEFKQNQQRLFNEIIRKSPEFDIDLYNNKDSTLKQRKESIDYENSALEEVYPKVECPYCHSTNTKKIGWLERLGSAELWGLGSSKIGKQFHCNNCGADF